MSTTLQARRTAVADEVLAVAPELIGGAEGSTFICWRALQSGTCPYGHEWQAVSSADDTVELPIATYGGPHHLRLSDDAWTATH